jgi:hypothetical protein
MTKLTKQMKEEGGKRMTDMIVLSLKLKKYTRRRR